MRSRGVTLVELLVAAAISIVVFAAGSAAFLAALGTQRRLADEDERWVRRIRFEDTLRSLLRSAYLAEGVDRTDTYFLAYAGANAAEGNIADTVTFTALGLRPAFRAVVSSDDFETRNEALGPVGGLREVSISTTPVNPPGNEQGAFLREQTPADGLPDEGGWERLLWDEIGTLQFEFWDGTAWQTGWDTNADPNLGLPLEVRVTYTLREAPDDPRSFTVRLRAADALLARIEAQNQAQQGVVQP
ncbi:MAG: type II secretion system protein GspJ [Fimbriimonadales bacterium]|nr:type II secretion system protein GspJ [Fimbriimonadales bacterium]